MLIGLWRLVEDVFEQIEKLHSQRFWHGDLELHNVVVCTGPIQTFLMDFGSSDRAFSGPETIWERRRSRDLFELLRLAIYLQCGLGANRGDSLANHWRIYRSCLTMLPRFQLVWMRPIAVQ